jgi:hypothetical protein
VNRGSDRLLKTAGRTYTQHGHLSALVLPALLHPHNLTLTLIHSLTHTISLSDTHSHTHKATLTWFSRSSKITHSPTHTISLSHSHKFTLTKPHPHTQLSLSLSLSLCAHYCPSLRSASRTNHGTLCSQSQIAGRADLSAGPHAVSSGHRRRQFSDKNDLLTCSA